MRLLVGPGEGVGEDDAALGVAEPCPGVRVELASFVARVEADLGHL